MIDTPAPGNLFSEIDFRQWLLAVKQRVDCVTKFFFHFDCAPEIW
jgi:hypothetical protein